jgi:hypothetical protein
MHGARDQIALRITSDSGDARTERRTRKCVDQVDAGTSPAEDQVDERQGRPVALGELLRVISTARCNHVVAANAKCLPVRTQERLIVFHNENGSARGIHSHVATLRASRLCAQGQATRERALSCSRDRERGVSAPTAPRGRFSYVWNAMRRRAISTCERIHRRRIVASAVHERCICNRSSRRTRSKAITAFPAARRPPRASTASTARSRAAP